MNKLKITLFQQKDSGETQILHSQWDKEIESEKKKELWDKVMSLIREFNGEIEIGEDRLKELRKKQ